MQPPPGKSGGGIFIKKSPRLLPEAFFYACENGESVRGRMPFMWAMATP